MTDFKRSGKSKKRKREKKARKRAEGSFDINEIRKGHQMPGGTRFGQFFRNNVEPVTALGGGVRR